MRRELGVRALAEEYRVSASTASRLTRAARAWDRTSARLRTRLHKEVLNAIVPRLSPSRINQYLTRCGCENVIAKRVSFTLENWAKARDILSRSQDDHLVDAGIAQLEHEGRHFLAATERAMQFVVGRICADLDAYHSARDVSRRYHIPEKVVSEALRAKRLWEKTTGGKASFNVSARRKR